MSKIGCGALVAAIVALLVSLRTTHTLAFPAEDLVDSLPGLDSGPPSSKWYSGYLSYRLPCMDNRLINTHYVYIEQQVELDVARETAPSSTLRRTISDSASANKSPLIFWSNGGPGASSLYGLLTEMGPYVLNDDSLKTDEYKRSGVPSLLKNPSTWNKLGSMLIFDAPAPVGFSFCDDDPAGDGLSCGGWNDESSAWNNYHALLKFYEKFPELVMKPLYLSGESYAGIYIPSFARKIVMHNTGEIPGHAEVGGRVQIPLKGFAVGDACAGKDINCGVGAPLFRLMFFAGHSQIPLKLMHLVHESCTADELHTPGGELSVECSNSLEKAMKAVGGFYEYALYDDCTYNNGLLRRKWPYISNARRNVDVGAKGALNDYVCGGGEVLEEYVRHPSVMKAFHVPPTSKFFDGDNGIGFNYTPTEPNLLPFYFDVGNGKYSAQGIRMLVYNGDTDPALDSFQAQNWTMNIGLNEIEEWRPWTLDGCRRMGGYVTRYDGKFDFVTIRGAGHMVPTNKPEAAFTFFKAWIRGEDYPEYKPDCEKPSISIERK